jgi:hypothetical protein
MLADTSHMHTKNRSAWCIRRAFLFLGCFVSLGTCLGVEEADVEWLREETYLQDVPPWLDIKASEFKTAEKQTRLLEIVRNVRRPPVGRDYRGDELKAARIAGTLLVRSGYDNAVPELLPLLQSSHPEIRMGAAQALAISKAPQACVALEAFAIEKMPLFHSDEYEPMDYVRCALLAASKEERNALAQRLIDAFTAVVGTQVPGLQRAVKIFRDLSREMDELEYLQKILTEYAWRWVGPPNDNGVIVTFLKNGRLTHANFTDAGWYVSDGRSLVISDRTTGKHIHLKGDAELGTFVGEDNGVKVKRVDK